MSALLRSRRQRWWATLALLFTMSAAWSIATPISAAPDEPAHIIRAAAVARGQFFGTPQPLTRIGPSAYVNVRVPEVFAYTAAVPACLAFRPDVPASCSPALHPSSTEVKVATYVGRYPPLYYLVVGLPSLAFRSATGIRLMRLLSALACCAFIASAFESATEARRHGLAVLAVAVALTPMVIFLSGTLNPNSVEIAAALTLWVSGLALLCDSGLPVSRRLLARTAISASVLVEMRGLSLLWIALIFVSLVAVADKARLFAVARDRAARGWGLLLAASTGFSLWWFFRYDPLAVLPSGGPRPGAALSTLFETSLGHVDAQLHQMIGMAGWLDTPAPLLTYVAWFALVASLVACGLAFGARRRSAVMACVALASIAVPILIEAPEASKFGFIWQGRYTLPLAMGIPLLGAFSLAGKPFGSLSYRASGPKPGLRLPLLVAIAVVLAQAAMFLQALRRYTVGLAGPLNPFGGHWSPPLGATGVTALFLVALCLYGVWLVGLTRGPIHEVVSSDTQSPIDISLD